MQRDWATPVPSVPDLATLNAYLRDCCVRDRDRVQAGQTESIGQRWAHEVAQALPLPAFPFDPCVVQPAKVDKYQTVRWDTNRYSVPRTAAFQAVTVKAYVDRVAVVQANFPALKDLDTYDFTAQPSMNKPKLVELTTGAWIEQHYNLFMVGHAGTGKTPLALALGLAACRHGWRVRFFTAAGLVNRLEEAQKQYPLDRFLSHLDRTDLLICDELGYLSFSRWEPNCSCKSLPIATSAGAC